MGFTDLIISFFKGRGNGAFSPKFDDSLILVYDTTINNQKEIILPIRNTPGNKIQVRWNNGGVSTHIKEKISHHYSTPGIYIIEVSNDFNSISGRRENNGFLDEELIRSQECLIKVIRFNSRIRNLSYAFYHTKNLDEIPNEGLENVTDMSYMFCNAGKLKNCVFEEYNYKSLETFEGMFLDAEIEWEKYNNFIEKLSADKSSLPSIPLKIQKNVTNLKRKKSNEENFNRLYDYGFEIEDGGYVKLKIEARILLEDGFAKNTVVITGTLSKIVKDNIIKIIGYTMEEKNGVTYVVPFFKDEDYFINESYIEIVPVRYIKDAFEKIKNL